MNLAGWVDKWGRAAPDRPAIALGGTTYSTYRQWAARSRAMAGNLRTLCRPEDRVAIAMTNRPEFLEALFAVWHAGLVAVPMNAKLHGEEFGYIIGDTQAALVLASPDRADDVARHGRTIATGSTDWGKLYQGDGIDPTPRRSNDLAWLFYTSGTTGRPKGAMLTHGIMMAQTLAYFAEIEPVRPHDRVLHAAPMSHGSGCYGLPFVAMGAGTVIPEGAGFEPEEIASLLSIHGNLSFFAAPTMVSRLLNNAGFAAADHRGLRTIIYGGAPMHLETLLRGLDLLGPKLAQIYGQGEVPMTITALSKDIHADRARHDRVEGDGGRSRHVGEAVEFRAEPDEGCESGRVRVRLPRRQLRHARHPQRRKGGRSGQEEARRRRNEAPAVRPAQAATGSAVQASRRCR